MRKFYIKESEFDLNSKQIRQILVRSVAVEEDVAVMQEVRGSKLCKDVNL